MAVLTADTFTASNGTAISGRTPDTTVSSRTWSTGSYFFSGFVGTIDIQNNKASIDNTDDGFAINTGVSWRAAYAKMQLNFREVWEQSGMKDEAYAKLKAKNLPIRY